MGACFRAPHANWIIGTEISDSILGTAAADFIFGHDGDDTINGGEGNDVIRGGIGFDSLFGDLGDDHVDGGDDEDTISGGGGNDILLGGDGNDRINGDDGDDLMIGGAGDDRMIGGIGNDYMFGDADQDFLQGASGADVLIGGYGFDELKGGAQADTMIGGRGDDSFNYELVIDDVNIPGGLDPQSTFSEHDVVKDFDGAGEDGGDSIILGTAAFAFAGKVNIDPELGTALPGASNGLVEITYAQRGRSTYLIVDQNDNGLFDGNDLFIKFAGRQNFTQDDFTRTIFAIAGTDDDDTITGTDEDDNIVAGGGNDVVFGLQGADTIDGGDGDDVLDGGGGLDVIEGGAGNDTILIPLSNAIAHGGEGNDVITGPTQPFFAAAGFDIFATPLGSVVMFGDGGDDDLSAGQVDGYLDGGVGADTLRGSAFDDRIFAGGFEFGGDGAQDLIVYSGEGRWSSESSETGDTIMQFEDGLDLFDMRGSGLQFSDLSIIDEGFQTTIISDRGRITIAQSVSIDEADFIFEPPPSLEFVL